MDQKGSGLLVLFGTLFLSLRAISSYVVPILEENYIPYQPSENVSRQALEDPPRQLSYPASLQKASFPLVVIVHSECLSCSITADREFVEALKVPGVHHVITATSPESFKKLQVQVPLASVEYSSEAVAKVLNLYFSPRVYGFDRRGQLTYIQSRADLPLTRAVQDCASEIKS